MSFLTTAHLMDKYGPLLSEKNLAEVLHMEPGTVRNQRGSGALGIPYIRQSRTPLFQGVEFTRKAAPALDAAFFLCKFCAVAHGEHSPTRRRHVTMREPALTYRAQHPLSVLH